MYIKRVGYLGYYLKEMNWTKFNSFLNYVSKTENKNKVFLVSDIVGSCLKYNIAPLEYFYFYFYKISKNKRETFAGTGFMYEYHLRMNPRNVREVLENKLAFLRHYSKFVRHRYASLSDIIDKPELSDELLNNCSGKIVLKSSSGQCGQGIEILKCKSFSSKSLIARMKATGNDLVEEFVVQHDDLNRLSSSGLNTVRIFTQLTKDDKVEVLGARLRITVNSYVDNLAAGNLAAPIDMETGLVSGPAVYSDITKNCESIHPITGNKIIGFKLPFWVETVNMVTQAALLNKSNRSIGWDIAITNEGPELIEGNHNWCKLLWQLPVKKGMKSKLLKYL